MTDQEMKLVLGGLLHDIGKVVYRQGGDRRKHSQIGCEFLRDEIGLEDRDVLDCVQFHHGDALKNAKIPDESPAYIVYIADNMASAADRREQENGESGFEIYTPLQPVFNILNRNNGKKWYPPALVNVESSINYPVDEKKLYTEAQYEEIVRNISDNLKGLEWNENYLNSLLEVLEANLSYIPASTSKNELPDISLFDHVKLTAAFAGCIGQYAKEKNIDNYREKFYKKSREFYAEEAFLLASLDMSGIQNFIYTISTKNALRTLRARSFYLEIMMEHIIDELLSGLGLSLANLIYSGGGHCYLLLPNTEKCRTFFDAYIEKTNQWFLEHFQTARYIAGAYEPCSSDMFKNEPEGAYGQMFRNLSGKLSQKKIRRYTAEQIIWLNSGTDQDYSRECTVCRRIGKVNEKGVCPICSAIEELSKKVLYAEFFTVIREKQRELPLPGGFSLVADSAETLKRRMAEEREDFVRAYGKNRLYTGKNISRKLWVGNYTNGNTFEEFAEEAEGIDRIGILRADVDNLGHAFVAGFDNPENHNRYVTLSRTAALSRQLSLFFKLYINQILEHGQYSIEGKEKSGKRSATIVYSGGDDLFIVGAWNEVIELAVDIRRKFEQYTEGTLTLSAGIGVYQESYPISSIAFEVAEMEESSKNMPLKNAVTLLEDGEYHRIQGPDGERMVKDGTFYWADFEKNVVEEKLRAVRTFFGISQDRGKAFLYNLLELIRSQEERINFARYVYLLSRMEPGNEADEIQKKAYGEFSEKMLKWVLSGKDRAELKTAITIYAYLTREEGEADSCEINSKQ